MKKSTKPKKSARTQAKMVKVNAALMGFVFTATIATSYASFVSLLAGAGTFAVFALGLVYVRERMRRKGWEEATQAQLGTMQYLLKGHGARLDDHARALSSLKDGDASNEAKVQGVQKPEAPQSKASKPEIQRTPEPMPQAMPLRAMRRGPRSEDAPSSPETSGDYSYLSDTVVRELIHGALAQNRIGVFVQPIVRLPQRQVRFYEMYARIRAKPGLYLPAKRYMKLAEQDNVEGRIDEILLLHSLKTLEESAHLEKAAPFFLNISHETLHGGRFMKRLLAFLSKNRALAPRLVFEMAQSDFNAMPPALLEIVRGLGTLGCSFSLDHIKDHDFDIARLQRHKVRYVKFPARMLLERAKHPQDFRAMRAVKSRLEANGIGVIVEKIETEEDLRALLDYDPHYGQGFLFGRPDLQGAYQKSPPQARRKTTGQDAA